MGPQIFVREMEGMILVQHGHENRMLTGARARFNQKTLKPWGKGNMDPFSGFLFILCFYSKKE